MKGIADAACESTAVLAHRRTILTPRDYDAPTQILAAWYEATGQPTVEQKDLI